MEDAVDLPAHRRDGRADRVRDVEVLRPLHRTHSRKLVWYENAATADDDQRLGAPNEFNAVDCLRQHCVGAREGGLQLRTAGERELGVAEVRTTGSDGCIRQSRGRTAEDERRLRQAVAHALGADVDGTVAAPDDAAAAERDRNEIGHAEVRADAADLGRSRRLAREAVGKHADVGGGPADIGDDGVAHAGQVRRAANAVRRPAADRQNGMAERMAERHECPVVLGEECLRAQPVPGQRRGERVRDGPGDSDEGGVEHGRVLTLEQPDGADLVAERDVDVRAQHCTRGIADGELVLGRDGREDTRDRDTVDMSGDALEKASRGLEVERHDLAAVELHAAVDDQLPGRDGLAQVVRPREERPDRVGRGAADPEEGHSAEPAPLQDRIRRVRRSEHHVRDAATLVAELRQHARQRRRDPAGHVGARRHLRLREQSVASVERDGVGVRPPDVDTDPEVRCRHAALRRARTRSRSRKRAGLRSRARGGSARSDRTGRRSRSHAARTAVARS